MFSLNHSNIADIEHRDLFAQNSPRSSRGLSIIAGLGAVALFASAHTFANAEEPSTRTAREHHACAVIMGLPQPGKLYDACTISLDQSLSELDEARLVSTDRSGCERKGVRPGTPAFAVCVVNAEKPQ